MRPRTHIVITDSGLGGLATCAALERSLRGAGLPRDVQLTYVNAWPFEDRGYNDLPDEAARAEMFDAALQRMAAMRPDRILIACNTLSILYTQTEFSRCPPVPVQGIIDAGVDLFAERLHDDRGSSIALIGTRTTIESGVHRDRLVRRGIDPARVASASCHGLAAAIERDVAGSRTAELIDTCASRVADAAPPGGRLFAGLCCTHYGYVAVRIVDAISRRTGRRVRALDPNLRLVGDLMADDAFLGDAPTVESAGEPEAESGVVSGPESGVVSGAVSGVVSAAGGVRPAGFRGAVTVDLVSKVELDETARQGIARLVEPVSAVTARALLSYTRVPDLF